METTLVIDFYEKIELFTAKSLTQSLLIIAIILLALLAAVRYFGDGGGGQITSDMIGLRGEALSTIGEKGKVFVRGEIWDAVAHGDLITRGDTIEVIGIREGLVLEIQKVKNV